MKSFPYTLFFIPAFLLLLLFPVKTEAQQVKVFPERDTILVGEQIKLHLRFSFPSNAQSFTFPGFENDTLTSRIEIISKGAIDTLHIDADSTELQQSLIITSFDTGKIAVPPLPFSLVTGKNTEPQILFSDSAFLTVNIMNVDTAQAIMDIRNPWGIPFQWRDYILHAIIGLVLLMFIIAGLYYYMRRKKGLPLFPGRIEPQLPPDEEALMALNKIKKEKIWRSGMIKDYYTILTDTIRIYIERRFEISAPEYTTDETLHALKQTETESETCKKLQHILETADMVKFAKGNPLPTENEHCLELAYDFVLNTRSINTESVTPENNDLSNSAEV